MRCRTPFSRPYQNRWFLLASGSPTIAVELNKLNLSKKRSIRGALNLRPDNYRRFFTALAAISLCAVAPSYAQQAAVISHAVANAAPEQMVYGPDGAFWFTEALSIGRYTIGGVLTQYLIPTFDALAGNIAVGPDGALWFTEFEGNNIGRITTAGIITEFPLPEAGSNPFNITEGPDGAMWFTESQTSVIGRITTNGSITEFPLPSSEFALRPEGITTGPDGALWFTEEGFGQIGRITTAGAITQYPIDADIGIGPSSITTGPDGALWFAGSNAIGRITTTGVITTYPHQTGGEAPTGIVSGPLGAVWFAQGDSAQIGEVTTAGVITLYDAFSSVSSVTNGPKGTLWSAGAGGFAGAIGQVVFPSATLTLSTDTGGAGTPVTVNGAGFAPSETVALSLDGTPGLAPWRFVSADSTGSFSLGAEFGAVPFGANEIVGTGKSSQKLGVALYTVEPLITITPKSGAPGTIATVKGYGFGPGQVFVYSTNFAIIEIGAAEADENGSFNLSVTIPSSTTPGRDKIVAEIDSGIRAQTDFTVE